MSIDIVKIRDAVRYCNNLRTEQPVKGKFSAIVFCDQDQQTAEGALRKPVMWFGQTLYLGTRHEADNMAPPIRLGYYFTRRDEGRCSYTTK